MVTIKSETKSGLLKSGTCLCTDLLGSLLIPVPTSPASFPALRVRLFGPAPPTPGFRLPPHRPRTSGGRAAPAKQSESRHRAHRRFSFPRAALGSGPGRLGGVASAAGAEPGAAGTNRCPSGFGIARLPASPREPARCVVVTSPAVRGSEPVSLSMERRAAPPAVEGLSFFSTSLRGA